LYLQTAIERLTGRSVDVWMERTLLKPLHLTRSSYVWCKSFGDNCAGGHDKNGNLKKSRSLYDRGNAAFSLYTTPTDYALFLIEMMKQDRSARHSLKAETIEKMTTLQVEPKEGDEHSRRSLGWVVASEEGGGWVCHSGSNGTGFQCNARFSPQRRSGCVIMTNSDNGRRVWESILATVDSMTPDDEPSTRTARATVWGAIQRTIKYDYRVMNPTSKAAGRFEVLVPLPLESPRQEIHYLHLSEPGRQRIFTDAHGQRLVRYSFDGLEAGAWVDLGFVVGVTLRNMHWDAAGQSADPNTGVLTPQQRARYLRAETNYSMDAESMRKAAADLTHDTKTDLDKLTRIHDYIIAKIRYVRDNTWDPAAVVLARGAGSCSEYNYVLSGLCRLAGLPTRSVGGSTSGFRDLPATDVIFHRWTEVFLSGYGWFPADCSRDANPIRGQRSHFGRVYTDVLVWCQQGGGAADALGWEYRAKLRVAQDDPGLKEDHRTRWFEFQPQEQAEAAYAWFRDGVGIHPGPDLLECALLHWEKATAESRMKMIRALAGAGRNECLRRAATLPEAKGIRRATTEELCDGPELADTVLERSRHLFRFRSWFRDNESDLIPTGDGRFKLTKKPKKTEVPTTTASSSRIWTDLAAELVGRLVESMELTKDKALVVMPVEDQTLAGLGDKGISLHAELKNLISHHTHVKLIDEVGFDRLMEERGPGRNEYWALANGDRRTMPGDMVPEVILVPLCITERAGMQKEEAVLYHIEFKALELSNCGYTQIIARRYRRTDKGGARPDQGLLVAGGDTVLARWEHDLVGRSGYDWPLAGIKSVLSTADAVLCNLECCISRKGTPADKGERCPFYYRARPEMLRCLTEAGVDLVTAANNHGGDYGPGSVPDTAAWCRQAGLVCVGIGDRPTVAEEPRLVRIGPVRVGVAGLDTTMSRSRVEENRPGTNYVSEKDLGLFRERMGRLGQWAEGRCDLLVLTIHWGDNWVRETPPAHREMARIAFTHGVDLILGHSAHRLQGIEVVDGKVVVYDMGNLLFDCELTPEGQQGGLFRVYLSPQGVSRVEMIPTRVLEGHTMLAEHEEAHRTLAEMRDLCSSLGTSLVVGDNVEGRPVGVVEIPTPRVTPRSPPGPDLTFATFPAQGEKIAPGGPEEVPPAAIPPDVQKVTPPASLAPGVELLAFRLPGTAGEGEILSLSTWWRVTGPVAPNVMPAFRLRVAGDTPRRGTPWYTRHDPGDWTVPLSRLRVGQIVEDLYPLRLAGIPAGRGQVFALVIDTAQTEGQRELGKPYLLGEVEIVPKTRK
jgi:poly-gamma-glutamate capsule biosynthesis protein CapA/YwtB (metallophosphatase superfamily)